ncbi:hypothetical protein FB451DRAFT_1415387 [Mycena latifolia]|nr:hypothetical protein FB451DRAFT_1415387 [Mycena latifolia]
MPTGLRTPLQFALLRSLCSSFQLLGSLIEEKKRKTLCAYLTAAERGSRLDRLRHALVLPRAPISIAAHKLAISVQVFAANPRLPRILPTCSSRVSRLSPVRCVTFLTAHDYSQSDARPRRLHSLSDFVFPICICGSVSVSVSPCPTHARELSQTISGHGYLLSNPECSIRYGYDTNTEHPRLRWFPEATSARISPSFLLSGDSRRNFGLWQDSCSLFGFFVSNLS